MSTHLNVNNLVLKSLHSVGWITVSKIANTIIQMGSKLILAWLLCPRDFGVVGLAALVIELAQRLSETGFGAALVQKEGDIKKYLHAAWTIQLIRGILIFLVIFIAAPAFVGFFKITGDSQNAVIVVRFLAFAQLIEACTSIGMVLLERDLHFRNIVICQISRTFANSGVAILLAFIFRNVWALVFGMLAGSIVSMVVSYLVHPYRPGICFDRKMMAELFGYGKWIFSYTLVAFLVAKSGDIFIAKLVGVTALGLYQMAFLIGMIFKNQISEIICRVTFPLFSRLQQDSERLPKAFLMSVDFALFFFLPAGVGMALIGDLFVKVCLNDQWLPIIRSLQILSIAGGILAVVRVIDQYFKAVGLPNVMFYQAVLEIIFVFVLIFPLTKIFGVEGVAITVCLAGAFHFMMAMHYSIEKLHINYLELTSTILPSIIGTIGMSVAVLLVKHSFLFNNALSLIVSVITGALVYLIIMVAYAKIAGTGTLKQLQMVKEIYVNQRSV